MVVFWLLGYEIHRHFCDCCPVHLISLAVAVQLTPSYDYLLGLTLVNFGLPSRDSLFIANPWSAVPSRKRNSLPIAEKAKLALAAAAAAKETADSVKIRKDLC